MTLNNTTYNFEVSLQENEINVLCIENAIAFRNILSDLWNQTQGGEGGFILYDRGREKSISKDTICIINVFSLDYNDKKILNRIFQEIKIQAEETLQEEIAQTNSCMIDFIEKLIALEPYNLDFDYEMDIITLLKAFNVHLDENIDSLLEKVVNYVRLLHQVCHINVFFFVNLRQYFTQEELKQIYEMAFYEKVHIVCIESVCLDMLNEEKCLIIDKDLCIIEL